MDRTALVAAEIAASRGPSGLSRQEDRSDIDAPGSLASLTGGRSLVRVADISRRGARLETYVPLERDSEMTLFIPGAAPLPGRIAWAGDFAAGLAFSKPLDEATLATLLAAYGFGAEDEDRPVVSRS